MPGDIWLGDLIRAFALVSAEDAALQRSITELLGLSQRMSDATDRAVGELDGMESAPSELHSESQQASSPDHSSTPLLSTGFAPKTGSAEGPSTLRLLTQIAYEPGVLPEWTVHSLPVRPAAATRAAGVRHLPLLAPRSTSAILQTALSQPAWEGDLDIPETVHRLAQGRPLTQVPRYVAPTLRFGVQVLVDLGAGMEPFQRDQQELVTQVRNTVGRERTDIRYFENHPLRGAGTGARLSWKDYAPPTRGTRVLILSDLGLGGPTLDRHRSTPAEWQELAVRLERAACTAVAFVPYPPRRWPPWARGLMELVHWDRQTTVGRVSRHRRRVPPR